MKRPIAILLVTSLIACHVEPPEMPGKEVKRRKSAQSTARASLQRKAAAEAGVVAGEQEHISAAMAIEMAMAERSSMIATRAAAEREAERYDKTILEAQEIATTCASTTPEKIVEVHKYLESFETELRRDTAISLMEPCRKLIARQKEKEYRAARASKDVIENLLTKDGLLPRWSPPSAGAQPTPKPPAELPPPNTDENEALKLRLATATAQIEGQRAEIQHYTAEAERAESLVGRIDGDQRLREQEWADATYASGKNFTGAGVAVTIAGAIGVSVGIYFVSLHSATQKTLEAAKILGTESETRDKISRQQNVSIATLALGIPLLIGGVLLLVGGKRRKDASQSRVTLAPGGAAIRF